MIKLSIIVPIYNAEQYVRQCLDSIINQTFKDIEIICVNDGSTDESFSILKEYAQNDPRIKIIHKQNFGYGHSVNIGIDNSVGEYIGIVESDDFIDTKMYQELYKIAENTDADIVKSGYWEYFDASNSCPERKKKAAFISKIKPPKPVFSIKEYPDLLRHHPSIWSAIYKRSFLQKHNIHFVEASGGGWVDNPFFMQTFCLAEKIAWTQDAYYFYRQTNLYSSTNSLVDWTIPLQRCIEIDDFFIHEAINNSAILTCFYIREFHYINKALTATGHMDVDVNALIINLILRMNEEIITNSNDLTKYEKQFFAYISSCQSTEQDPFQLSNLPQKTFFNSRYSKLINKLKILN